MIENLNKQYDKTIDWSRTGRPIASIGLIWYNDRYL